MASRILGMGDVISLVEKASMEVSGKSALVLFYCVNLCVQYEVKLVIAYIICNML